MSKTNDWTSNEWLSAQSGCIGCVLQSPKLAGRLLAETSEEDFDGTGRMVYQAIAALFSEGKSPDAVQVGEKLGGAYNDYLLQCIEIVPSLYNFDSYIDIVREKARMSRVQLALYRAAAAPTIETMEAELASANELMVAKKHASSVPIGELFVDWYSNKTRGETFIQTGFPSLDKRLRMRPGNFVVIAARPSRGKTALALQLALQQSKTHRVGFYSYETDRNEIMDRLVSCYTQIPFDRISMWDLTEDEDEKVRAAYEVINTKHKFDFNDAVGMSPDDVFHEALARRHEIIFIDYIQIMRSSAPAGERYNAVTSISMRLHELARQHKILVFGLAQLNREIKTRDTEEPTMYDIKESGQIEQDADVILMLYCYQKELLSGPRALKIAKNKAGPVGAKLALLWDGLTQTMTPTSRQIAGATATTFSDLPDTEPVPEKFLKNSKKES